MVRHYLHVRFRKSAGFSLVELSIVLVILGLLVGGVLSGQSLIRAAELRSLSTIADKYRTAIYSFRDKYLQLPGDMTNATSFWGSSDGSVSGTTGACYTTIGTGTATCNGNGDSLIGPEDSVFKNAPTRFEIPMLFKHLANAGLIEGTFTGAENPPAVAQYLKMAIGINAPATRLPNVGMVYYHFNRVGVAGNTNFFHFSTTKSNILQFGLQDLANASANEMIGRTFFKPEEAWNLDTKMDDGKPGTGKFIATGVSYPDDVTQCTTSLDGTDFGTAEYNLSTATNTCGFYLREN